MGYKAVDEAAKELGNGYLYDYYWNKTWKVEDGINKSYTQGFDRPRYIDAKGVIWVPLIKYINKGSRT